MSAETTEQKSQVSSAAPSGTSSRLGFIQRFYSLFGFSSEPSAPPEHIPATGVIPLADFTPKCPSCGVFLEWPESPEPTKASCSKCSAKFSLPRHSGESVPQLLKHAQDAYDYAREMEKELDDKDAKFSADLAQAQELRVKVGHVYGSLASASDMAETDNPPDAATQLESIRRAHDNQKDQLIQQTARVMTLKEDAVALSRQITELTNKTMDLVAQLDDAKEQIKEKNNTIEELEEQIEGLHEEIGEKDDQIAGLTQINVGLRANLEAAESTIQSLKEQLSAVRKTKKPIISPDVTIVEVASLWDALPSGTTERELKAYTRQIEQRAHVRGWNVDYTRIEAILKLKPSKVLIPKKRARQVLDPAKHWFGYSVYLFEWSDKVVLLCPVIGNAVYVLGVNWRKLIVKQKRQVREDSEGTRHAVHKGGTWLDRVEADLRGRRYVSASTSGAKPIRTAGGNKARPELQLSGRELATEIRATLRAYSSSHSCYLDDLGGHVLKYLGITTRAEPRRQFCRKVVTMARTMTTKRDLKIYTASSGRERVKLR